MRNAKWKSISILPFESFIITRRTHNKCKQILIMSRHSIDNNHFEFSKSYMTSLMPINICIRIRIHLISFTEKFIQNVEIGFFESVQWNQFNGSPFSKKKKKTHSNKPVFFFSISLMRSFILSYFRRKVVHRMQWYHKLELFWWTFWKIAMNYEEEEEREIKKGKRKKGRIAINSVLF